MKSGLGGMWAWLTDPAHWTGTESVPQRVLEHLGYTVLTMVITLVIAIPLGAWIGHTGKGGFLVVGFANGLRALPTLGLLVLLASAVGIGLLGPLVSLVILAVPAVLAGTYAGIRNIDAAVIDAALGMGMRGREILWKVELPNAAPLIIGGVRGALLQVISTATIAAFVGLGGLGRIIIDGLAVGIPQMAAGALLVALLAIAADLLLSGLQRLIVSPGLQAVPTGRRRLRPVPDPHASDTARAPA